MQLQTIEMDRLEARKLYVEFRNSVTGLLQGNLDEANRRLLESDRALRDGYKQLSMGRQLIRMSETLAAGGRFDDGLPRLALMRADFASIHLRAHADGRVVFEPNDGRAHRHDSKVLEFTIPPLDPNPITWALDRQATVPIVPPALRPQIHIRNFHVLWEVEAWAEWRQRPRSRSRVGDPAILRHLRGDLWAVLGVWDLTDLEKASLENGAVLG